MSSSSGSTNSGEFDDEGDDRNDEEPSKDVAIFAPCSHIPYRVARDFINRGGEPILVPAHPT